MAILFGLVPLTFWIAGPLGVTGLIIALVGRARVKRGEATNGKTALFGVLTSIGALALSIWGATIVFGAFEDAADELDRSIDEFESYTECVDAIEVDDPDSTRRWPRARSDRRCMIVATGAGCAVAA